MPLDSNINPNIQHQMFQPQVHQQEGGAPIAAPIAQGVAAPVVDAQNEVHAMPKGADSHNALIQNRNAPAAEKNSKVMSALTKVKNALDWKTAGLIIGGAALTTVGAIIFGASIGGSVGYGVSLVGLLIAVPLMGVGITMLGAGSTLFIHNMVMGADDKPGKPEVEQQSSQRDIPGAQQEGEPVQREAHQHPEVQGAQILEGQHGGGEVQPLPAEIPVPRPQLNPIGQNLWNQPQNQAGDAVGIREAPENQPEVQEAPQAQQEALQNQPEVQEAPQNQPEVREAPQNEPQGVKAPLSPEQKAQIRHGQVLGEAIKNEKVYGDQLKSALQAMEKNYTPPDGAQGEVRWSDLQGQESPANQKLLQDYHDSLAKVGEHQSAIMAMMREVENEPDLEKATVKLAAIYHTTVFKAFIEESGNFTNIHGQLQETPSSSQENATLGAVLAKGMGNTEMNLASLQFTTVQRTMRVAMPLDEMVKILPKDSEAFAALTNAIGTVKELTLALNASKALFELKADAAQLASKSSQLTSSASYSLEAKVRQLENGANVSGSEIRNILKQADRGLKNGEMSPRHMNSLLSRLSKLPNASNAVKAMEKFDKSSLLQQTPSRSVVTSIGSGDGKYAFEAFDRADEILPQLATLASHLPPGSGSQVLENINHFATMLSGLPNGSEAREKAVNWATQVMYNKDIATTSTEYGMATRILQKNAELTPTKAPAEKRLSSSFQNLASKMMTGIS